MKAVKDGKKGKRKTLEAVESTAPVKEPSKKRKAVVTSADDAFDFGCSLQVDLSSLTTSTNGRRLLQPHRRLLRRRLCPPHRSPHPACKGGAEARGPAGVEARELALARPTAAPTVPADFERLLLASPNSSYLWTRYMAHHLAAQTLDDARAVARRAPRHHRPSGGD